MADEHANPPADGDWENEFSRAVQRSWHFPTKNGIIAKSAQLGTTISTVAGGAELAGLSPRDTIVAGAVAALASRQVRQETETFLDNLHEEQGKPLLSETTAPEIRKGNDPDAPPKEPLRTRAKNALKGLFELPVEESTDERKPGFATRVGQAAYHRAANLTGAAAGLASGGAAGAVIGQGATATAATLAAGAAAGHFAGKKTKDHLDEKQAGDLDAAKAAAKGVGEDLGKSLRNTEAVEPAAPVSNGKDKGRSR